MTITITLHHITATEDDQFKDISVLTQVRTELYRLITVTNKLDISTPEQRTENLGNIYILIQKIESARHILSQSIEIPEIRKLITDIGTVTEQATALLRVHAEDTTRAEWHANNIKVMFLGNISARIESIVNFRVNEHDQHSRYERVILMFSLSVITICLVLQILLGPVSTFIIIKNSQRKLNGMNRIKGDYLANLTHEIRTPINGIVGMADLLMDAGLDARAQHYTRSLQGSAEHLLCLINDVLDFSKLEAGQMRIRTSRFNLHSLAEDVLSIMGARAGSKNIELLLDYDELSACEIEADPARLRQILFNLVGNAIKFTDDGYVLVRLSVKQGRQQYLFCEVEDTGAGIPENKISQLFRKYAQIENTSDKAKDGTGLGLAICRNLLQLMGGDIRVRSKPGIGTIFSWQIPLKAVYGQAMQMAVPLNLGGRRILLMDDLAPNRSMYQRAIEQQGASCLVSENAEELFSCLDYEMDCGRKPSLIVLDHYVPGTNGLECAKRIRSNLATADIPVMILTFSARSDFIDQTAGIAQLTHLVKPISPRRLCESIDSLFNGIQEVPKYKEDAESIRFNLRVLLAEDNRVNAEISTNLLERYGCKVDWAENGFIAYEKAQKESFDMILMDCQMPVMDGFESAQRLSGLMKTGKIPSIPIIALTANAADGDRELCIASGMADYLCKPVRKNEMASILKKWTDEKKLNLDSYMPTEYAEPQNIPSKKDNAANQDIDYLLFKTAYSALGARAVTVIGYYIEDSVAHLSNLKSALEQKNYREGILPAHSLKSSSQQFGLTELSALAGKMEGILRQSSAGPDRQTVEELAERMTIAFKKGSDFLSIQATTLPQSV